MSLVEQITELRKDLKEVKHFLDLCERERVKKILTEEKTKIEKELNQLQEDKEATSDKSVKEIKGYTVKISNYGWDQSEKFVKVYITLKGVHKIPAENVEVSFTEKSFNVLVKDLEGKNYQMVVNNLLWPITAEESSKKIKTDMILVMCKKSASKKWDCFTQVEKQAKAKEKPSYDDNSDPGEGLMTMLKKMYSDGDDEMKRTINKAWAESQDKKHKGDDFGF